MSAVRFQTLPWWAANWLYLKSIALDCAHRLVFHRRRERSLVNSDYDQGAWLSQLQDRRWERVASFSDYVTPTDDRRICAMIDGEIVTTTVGDYLQFRTAKLVETLDRFARDVPELVEIGSGAGQNLFAAAWSGRWERIRGYDLSATGRSVTRAVADHFNLGNVTAAPIDLLDFGSDGYSQLRGCTAFSFYCLEQLPKYTDLVISNLIKAGVRRMIHIEPTLELLSPVSLKDLATITYIWRQDYLRNLVATARSMERAGKIRIVAVERLQFAPTHRNDPTLLVWDRLD